MKDESLSSKIQYNLSNRGTIYAENVKEFVKKLKGHFFYKEDRYFIDKIFGNKLI